MSDPVNHPNHYVVGGVELFDILRTVNGDESAFGFALGNVWKYCWRATGPNAKHADQDKQIEDLRKAAKYIEFAIEILEADE